MGLTSTQKQVTVITGWMKNTIARGEKKLTYINTTLVFYYDKIVAFKHI